MPTNDDYSVGPSYDYGLPYSAPYRSDPDPPPKKVPYHRAKRIRLVPPPPSLRTKKTSSKGDIERTFERLASIIDERYGPTAFFREVHACPEYLQIVGMGPAVLPVLLNDLAKTGRPWFLALRAITRLNVGDDVDPGNLRALKEAWIAWGKANGMGTPQ